MKKRTGSIIASAILATFIALFCGCNKNNSLADENADKLLQSYLTQTYVGERENGSKVYLIEKRETASRYLIRKRDGSFKQAVVFGRASIKKILDSSQDKCIEIYKDPNYITAGQTVFDQLLEIVDDDGTDCSWMTLGALH